MPRAEYGRFFLSWYSGLLTRHADRVLTAAKEVLTKRCRPRRVQERREVSRYCWEWRPYKLV